MKNKPRFSFSLDIILVKDPKIGGFTAFTKQFPNILAEGDTQNDAVKKLMDTIHDVFKYKSEISKTEEIEGRFKVYRKSFEFCSPSSV